MIATKKQIIISLGLGLTMVAAQAFAYTGQDLAGKAKINLKAARALALKAQPGKITSEELEQEKGGSGLRYSFDIRHDKSTREVGVDAKSGKILENSPEGPDAD